MKEIKNYWKLLKSGTKTMFKEFFNKQTNKKQRANMLTFSRLIISFIIPILTIVAIISSLQVIFTSIFIATGIGALTDFLDGRSARKHNSYSKYGKFLDQLADKSFAGMLGISLSFLNPMFLINILGELIVFATNFAYKLKNENLNLKSTTIGKIKEWPLFISLALGFLSINNPILHNVVNASIFTTLAFQLATIASYINQNETEIKKEKEKNEYQTSNLDVKETKEEKVKTLQKSNYNQEINNLNKKEQLINLRNVLLEIKELKEEKNITIEKTYQKY